MATEQAQPLALVEQKERFVFKKVGVKYAHKNKHFDLRTIDTATAEALANDPSCRFLQWKDASNRPQGQLAPLDVPDAPTAKAAGPAKDDKK